MARLAWLALLAACGHSDGPPTGSSTPPAAPTSAAAPGALPQAFDGIAIGGSFASVEARSPYDKACDSDPLEHERSIRAMIYAGGRPCHRVQFPDSTSVVILVEGDKIAAFGWMGGTYFDSRSGLPLKIGEPIDRAIAQWGKPAATFDLQTMHVARFGNGLRVMSGRFDQIIGFAIGDLPDDPTTERWRTFDHLYGAYTTPVGNPAVSADECRKVATRLYEVAGSKEPVAESDVADCRANNTPEMNRCILAAKTSDAVGTCYKH